MTTACNRAARPDKHSGAIRANVRVGSNLAIQRELLNVRSTLESGHRADVPERLSCASRRHSHQLCLANDSQIDVSRGLLEYIVRNGEEVCWNFESEGVRDFQIDC